VSTEPDARLERLIERYPGLAACRSDIAAAEAALRATFESGGKLLLCGNGGSAADCEHIAGELLKGFERKRPIGDDLRKRLKAEGAPGVLLAERLQGGLPAISLCGHPSLASALANDVEPVLVFAQLVCALGRKGDALLAISTSGEARNVVLAAVAARGVGMKVVGLSGRGGGELRERCDVVIDVPGGTTPDVQELHLPVYHHLCRALEASFFRE
jgi:D-sedoheptulose 7-phosphate isomerase